MYSHQKIQNKRDYLNVCAHISCSGWVMEEVRNIPHIEKLLEIKGVGVVTVAGFLSETGDISRFTSPKQIQKLAGLEIKETSSGKHKGRSSISKRGRKRLRKLLFQVVLPLIRSNTEFRSVYEYYTNRIKNPLKSKQAMAAVACKLIRVFYAILTKGTVGQSQILCKLHFGCE